MKATAVALVIGATLPIAPGAIAQPVRAAGARSRANDAIVHPTTAVALPGPNSLLGHFGVDEATRLMRSHDADERLRGVERAAAAHTLEALALLERVAGGHGSAGLDPRLPEVGMARKDPRELLAVVRGLAAWIDDEGARAALEDLVVAPIEAPAAEDEERGPRVTLAREEAAIALAGSDNPVALEHLVADARSGGAAQEAALVGLSIHPPSDPAVLGGVALATPATIALAVGTGDLRTLDAIIGIMRASDPALRAAALRGLGAAGDTRVVGLARAALTDSDERVRVAAVEALARLSTPDAATAVETLIGDDATALEGLRIARDVQGEGITKAAAARVAATADPAVRGAAIAVLGRQTNPLAVRALVALAAAPQLQGDALGELARSPSPAALEALEQMAADGPGGPLASSRRLAGRAYFVRRFVRGVRSRRLDALLDGLAVSGNPRDRAVGMQALVALGERRVDAALSDPDARVRRAGAMGALGRWDATAAQRLVARGAVEPDEATRRVLALGWTAPAAGDLVSTSVLVERARAGGPDAPVAAFALACQSDEALSAQVDALLDSRDPILRAQAARGLGLAGAPDAAGRLTRAYAWEADPRVRRAIVSALAVRAAAGAPGTQAIREGVLDLAARLDPDPVTRWTASTAMAPGAAPAPLDSPVDRDITWIRLVAAEGAAPALDRTALLVPSDAGALPIVFDDEGYALVPGVSPGEARLRLAPDPPPYSAPAP